MKLNVAVQSISAALGYDYAEQALSQGLPLRDIVAVLAAECVEDYACEDAYAPGTKTTIPVGRI